MRLLSTLALVVVLVLFIGWMRGWVTFTKTDSTGDDRVSVTVDQTKAKQDAKDLADKARNALEEKKESDKSSATSTAAGKITVISGDQKLALSAANTKELKLDVDSATTITLNDRTASLGDLRVGDEATVVYESKGGKNFARSVAANHKVSARDQPR
jgi:hypothetical protein